MGYMRNLNEPIPGDPVTLVPSGTRTAAGSGPTLTVDLAHTLRMTLAVTAVSGTSPSLTVTVEHSENGSTWATHSSFAAATAVSSQRKVVSGLDRFVRCSWTVAGTTPSFTFSVTGDLV